MRELVVVALCALFFFGIGTAAGQVTLHAIGPLTNIAQAIRAEPEFAGNVKQFVIIGAQ